MLSKIKSDIISILIPRVKENIPIENPNDDIIYHINPTGKFVIGGTHGDTGLTGRKIIVDTYMAEKVLTVVEHFQEKIQVRSIVAYATRHIAKNLIPGLCEECLVQVGYAIGVAEPMGIYINLWNSM